MRIKHKVNVRIWDDTTEYNALFAPDDTRAEVIISGYVRQTSGKFSIAATANENLALGDITAVKGLYLVVDQDCQVKINGDDQVIQLRKGATTTGTTAKFFIEADITAVNITAPAGSAVTGMYCVWGDTT